MGSNIKIVNVSKSLGIEHWPNTPQDGLAIFDNSENSISVTPAELPDLIARLTDAAGEMGVETAQGELVKALRLAVEYLTTIACDPNHRVLVELRAALAKAE